MFKTKSVHTPMEAKDGLRILAARGRGRGLPADRFDVWMANVGPSEELRDAILAGKISWSEFTRRYFKELYESGGVDARNKRIKNLSRVGWASRPPVIASRDHELGKIVLARCQNRRARRPPYPRQIGDV